MPKASTFVCSVSKGDDCGIAVFHQAAARREERVGLWADEKRDRSRSANSR